MPPTTRVTEDVLAGCLLDAFFNLAGLMTDQSILCVGLLPDGADLPFRADRELALANISYVRAAAGLSGCRSPRTRSSSTGRTRCWTRR